MTGFHPDEFRAETRREIGSDPDHRDLASRVRPPAAVLKTGEAASALARELAVLPWRLASHAERWPSHGFGCPCSMDAIRRVREAAQALERSGPHGRQAVRHLRFVLDSALRQEDQ